MTKITLDFETRSAANLKKVGAYEYSLHPTTIATCLGFKSNQSERDHLFDFHAMQKNFVLFPIKFQTQWLNWIKDSETVFSAHNAFFEQCIYQNVLVKRFNWPAIKIPKWRCTAAKAAAVAIPRNLDGAGQVMRLTTQKSFEGHRIMMKLCKPTTAWVKWDKHLKKLESKDIDASEWLKTEPAMFWEPETAPVDFRGLYAYCRIDVKTEELLDESLPDLTPKEQQLWFYDQLINHRGVAVDMEVVNKISGIMASESKIMGKELDILTMGLVSSGNARNQILEFLKLEDIEMPDLKAKTVDDFLANGRVTGDAKKLLEIRRALSKASTAKYQKFQGCAESDGRVRDLFLYHGASTGRWGGKNVQPQNFPRGIIKNIEDAIENIKSCDLETLKLLYGENLMPLFSSVLRGMFIASEGCEMFIEDWSAIECRVVWWLADHQAGLDMFRRGEDPYKDQASEIFNKPVSEIPDSGDERQTGKAAVLGCSYQMGWKKFITAAWEVYRVFVTPEIAKVAVTSYREKHYPVTELWTNYNNACIFAIENEGAKYNVGKVSFHVENSFLWITLPSGRRLAYKDPSVVWADVNLKDDEGNVTSTFKTKQVRYYAINQKAKKEDCHIPGVKWTREATYGGKLTENIVQAVARDLLGEAIVRAEKNGFKVLMHSHDEMVAEAPIGTKTSIEYRKIMETLPKWAEGLPLKSGGWSGTRYRKG